MEKRSTTPIDDPHQSQTVPVPASESKRLASRTLILAFVNDPIGMPGPSQSPLTFPMEQLSQWITDHGFECGLKTRMSLFDPLHRVTDGDGFSLRQDVV